MSFCSSVPFLNPCWFMIDIIINMNRCTSHVIGVQSQSQASHAQHPDRFRGRTGVFTHILNLTHCWRSPAFLLLRWRSLLTSRLLFRVSTNFSNIWLVVEPYPSEKWWSSSVGMMTFLIWWESHNPAMFQTTNFSNMFIRFEQLSQKMTCESVLWSSHLEFLNLTQANDFCFIYLNRHLNGKPHTGTKKKTIPILFLQTIPRKKVMPLKC